MKTNFIERWTTFWSKDFLKQIYFGFIRGIEIYKKLIKESKLYLIMLAVDMLILLVKILICFVSIFIPILWDWNGEVLKKFRCRDRIFK